MTQTLFLAQLRVIILVAIAYAAGKGWLSSADSSAITSVLTPIGVIAGPWLWSIYSNFNSRIVPRDSVVIAPHTPSDASAPVGANVAGKVIAALLFAVIVNTFMVAAYAADLPVKSRAAASPAISCVAANCSGWYGGFGFMGNGTNADIVGSGLNGSVFAAGGALKVNGGYQLWNGNWFAAIEGAIGYEFTTTSSKGLPIANGGGSKFIGQELIKLGYNFFPSTAVASTIPSQSPVPLLTPANLLAASTPYLVGGGIQRRGASVWANGVGVETVIASGWSASADYLYAPAQQGLDATSIVQLTINKHF
jgi:opacity protein-like surface antigen